MPWLVFESSSPVLLLTVALPLLMVGALEDPLLVVGALEDPLLMVGALEDQVPPSINVAKCSVITRKA